MKTSEILTVTVLLILTIVAVVSMLGQTKVAPTTTAHRFESITIRPLDRTAVVKLDFFDVWAANPSSRGKAIETRTLVLEGKDYPEGLIRPLIDAIDAGLDNGEKH